MQMKDRLDQSRIAIIGLGYVGLPLAVEFGKQFATVGYDIHAARIAELQKAKVESSKETAAARQKRFAAATKAL